MRVSSTMMRSAVLVTCLVAGCQDGVTAPEHAEMNVAADVVAHRLNRAEYDNTVRDLLGTALRPAVDFPADERGHGFDNMVELLSMSPERAALYERAASELARDVVSDPKRRSTVLPCDSDDEESCARQGLEHFLPRAWRRPVTQQEVDSMVDLYGHLRTGGDDSDEAMQGVVGAALLSPHFLFRIEHAPAEDTDQPQPLSDWELASRLSYFLWSSMPDDELFALADGGTLDDPDVLREQVDRMLEDEKAQALVDDFAGQWWHIRGLQDVFKDVTKYPRFDDDLRDSMRIEMESFFSDLIAQDADLRDLLLGSRTTVDRPMLELYGVASSHFGGTRELDLSSLPRTGMLTMPGLMTVLSRPFRTAPVKRGQFVMSQLLCAPLPPPPDGVEGLTDIEPGETFREMLERHRQDPSCAGCHATLDPLGLAFEHYNGIGAWRATDDGVEIDASGTLPDGRSFSDAVELGNLLSEDPRFVECVVRQTMTYALGRGLQDEDEAHVRSAIDQLVAAGYRTRALFSVVATSVPFRHHQPLEAP